MSRTVKAAILLAALIVYAIAYGQDTVQLKDYATYYAPSGTQFFLGFQVDPADPNPSQWVQFRRTRLEGGPQEFSGWVARAQWAADVSIPNQYYVREVIPRGGHFIYDIRLCTACDDAHCSEWMTSIDPERAVVDGLPRAWWVYGYLGAPGQPEVNWIPLTPDSGLILRTNHATRD